MAASLGGLDRRLLPAEQLECAQGAARGDGLAIPQPRAGRGAEGGGFGVLGSRARSVFPIRGVSGARKRLSGQGRDGQRIEVAEEDRKSTRLNSSHDQIS